MDKQSQTAPRKAKVQARLWLFPLAAVYAGLLLPLSVLGVFAQIPAPAGLQTALGHAHEMLFGMAFLVVSGYLLGPLPRVQLAVFTGLWLLARIAFLGFPFSWLAMLFTAGYAGLLIKWVVPRFWRAQKWRNKSVAPLVLLLGLAALVAGYDAHSLRLMLDNAMLILAALMFFMGGRIIAPALASFWLQQSIRMENRVQPNIEGAGLIALAVALLLQLTGIWPAARAAVLLVGAALVWLRLLRWQPWQYRWRLDLFWLFVGYAALGLALLLLAAGFVWPLAAQMATHALTVGAMGLLMVTVMARVTMLRRFKDANALPVAHVASALMLLAACLRVLAPALPTLYLPLLHSAMLFWSLSFSCLLWVFWRSRQ